MAQRIPLVLDSNGDIQQLQASDTLSVVSLVTGPEDRQLETTIFNPNQGLWVSLPTNGPSAFGSGEPGDNAWLGYCFVNGDWCSNSLAGDLAYRNLYGRLLWGTSEGPYQMMMSTAGLTIATPVTVPTMVTTDNSSNVANTAFVKSAIAAAMTTNSRFFSGSVGMMSGSTQIAVDNTPPLVTSGSQLWSQSITPLSSNEKFDINFLTTVDTNTNNRTITLTLFRGSTLIAFACVNGNSANRPQSIGFSVVDSPNTTTPVVYSCRIGVSGAATWYLGRTSSATVGGPSCLNSWTIRGQ